MNNRVDLLRMYCAPLCVSGISGHMWMNMDTVNPRVRLVYDAQRIPTIYERNIYQEMATMVEVHAEEGVHDPHVDYYVYCKFEETVAAVKNGFLDDEIGWLRDRKHAFPWLWYIGFGPDDVLPPHRDATFLWALIVRLCAAEKLRHSAALWTESYQRRTIVAQYQFTHLAAYTFIRSEPSYLDADFYGQTPEFWRVFPTPNRIFSLDTLPDMVKNAVTSLAMWNDDSKPKSPQVLFLTRLMRKAAFGPCLKRSLPLMYHEWSLKFPPFKYLAYDMIMVSLLGVGEGQWPLDVPTAAVIVDIFGLLHTFSDTERKNFIKRTEYIFTYAIRHLFLHALSRYPGVEDVVMERYDIGEFGFFAPRRNLIDAFARCQDKLRGLDVRKWYSRNFARLPESEKPLVMQDILTVFTSMNEIAKTVYGNSTSLQGKIIKGDMAKIFAITTTSILRVVDATMARCLHKYESIIKLVTSNQDLVDGIRILSDYVVQQASGYIFPSFLRILGVSKKSVDRVIRIIMGYDAWNQAYNAVQRDISLILKHSPRDFVIIDAYLRAISARHHTLVTNMEAARGAIVSRRVFARTPDTEPTTASMTEFAFCDCGKPAMAIRDLHGRVAFLSAVGHRGCSVDTSTGKLSATHRYTEQCEGGILYVNIAGRMVRIGEHGDPRWITACARCGHPCEASPTLRRREGYVCGRDLLPTHVVPICIPSFEDIFGMVGSKGVGARLVDRAISDSTFPTVAAWHSGRCEISGESFRSDGTTPDAWTIYMLDYDRPSDHRYAIRRVVVSTRTAAIIQLYTNKNKQRLPTMTEARTYLYKDYPADLLMRQKYANNKRLVVARARGY